MVSNTEFLKSTIPNTVPLICSFYQLILVQVWYRFKNDISIFWSPLIIISHIYRLWELKVNTMSIFVHCLSLNSTHIDFKQPSVHVAIARLTWASWNAENDIHLSLSYLWGIVTWFNALVSYKSYTSSPKRLYNFLFIFVLKIIVNFSNMIINKLITFHFTLSKFYIIY